MAKFKPGTSGNEKGRPKGATNKTTQHLRENISNFLEDNFEDVQTTFDQAGNREKLNFYKDLLAFALPKLQSIESVGQFETLTDEQLQIIIDELNQSYINNILKN